MKRWQLLSAEFLESMSASESREQVLGERMHAERIPVGCAAVHAVVAPRASIGSPCTQSSTGLEAQRAMTTPVRARTAAPGKGMLASSPVEIGFPHNPTVSALVVLHQGTPQA